LTLAGEDAQPPAGYGDSSCTCAAMSKIEDISWPASMYGCLVESSTDLGPPNG